MSFTLRQVTQRAGGGEIVRKRTVDAETITIGRGTDCDLQLPDLAVSLLHARMTQTGAGRVTVQAEPGQSFEADGGFTSKATLDVAKKPRLIFGSHALSLSPGAAPDEVAITIERLDGREGKTGDDEVRTFSPGAVGLSKRATAWVLGTLIVALCLAWPISAFYAHQNQRIHADQQWSSGPLSKTHAFLAKDCQACHQKAFVAIRDEACQSCHQAGKPEDQLATARRARARGAPENPHFVGGHADFSRLMRATPLPDDFGGKVEAVFRRVFNHPDTRCASCHREHLDPAGQKMAPGQSRAPVRDKPTLVQAQDCAACHGGMKARLPDTQLIDVSTWAKHPEFRPVVQTSPGPVPQFIRTVVGPQTFERTGLKFGHRIHLSATGGVARMGQVLGLVRTREGGLDCAACHRPDASGVGFKPLDMPRDCGDCHSLAFARTSTGLKLLPHGHPDQVVATLTAFYASGGPSASMPDPALWSRRMPGTAAESRTQVRHATSGVGGPAAVAAGVRGAFSPGGACYDCHTVLTPSQPGSLAYGIAPVHVVSRYLPRGAFDHSIRAHRLDQAGRQTCADCHKASTSDRSEDLLLPKMADCTACHGKSPGQVRDAARADCAECHSYHAPSKPERAPAPADKVAMAAQPMGRRKG